MTSIFCSRSLRLFKDFTAEGCLLFKDFITGVVWKGAPLTPT
jgi:hypothetical protein